MTGSMMGLVGPASQAGSAPNAANARNGGGTGATGSSGPAFASFLPGEPEEGPTGDPAGSLDDETVRRARQAAGYALPTAAQLFDGPTMPGAGFDAEAPTAPMSTPPPTVPTQRGRSDPFDTLPSCAAGSDASFDFLGGDRTDASSSRPGSLVATSPGTAENAGLDEQGGGASASPIARILQGKSSPSLAAGPPALRQDSPVAAPSPAAAPDGGPTRAVRPSSDPATSRLGAGGASRGDPGAPLIAKPASEEQGRATSSPGLATPAAAIASSDPSGLGAPAGGFSAHGPIGSQPSIGGTPNASGPATHAGLPANRHPGDMTSADASKRSGATTTSANGADRGTSPTSTATATTSATPAVDPATALGAPVKSMTVVTKMAPTPTAESASPAGERLREAFASIANQSVIRGAASGEIVLPDLGRVAVHARSTAGGVDVDVTADRADARAALRAHAGAMEVDLRQADLRVGHLTVDRSHATTSQHGAASGDRGRSFDSSSHQGSSSSRDNDGDDVRDAAPAADSTTADASAGRVRIVL